MYICKNKGSEFYQKMKDLRLTACGALSGRRDRIMCGNARKVITETLTTIAGWQLPLLNSPAEKFLVNSGHC